MGIRMVGDDCKRDRGSSLIEFAIALLIVIPIFMGVFDLGRAVYIHSVVAASAQEAARYGIVHPSDIAGIENAARSRAAGLDPSLMNIVVSQPDSSTIEVAISYDFTAVTPFIDAVLGGGGQLTLNNTARMGF
ncbi:MAG: pilus assembly protein [Chloroflexi bacterium]|nr:pilus assembly protein [Chloroflexota bacterium]